VFIHQQLPIHRQPFIHQRPSFTDSTRDVTKGVEHDSDSRTAVGV